MKYRKRLLTLIPILLLSFLFYLSEDDLDNEQASKSNTLNPTKPSAFTENSQFTIYNELGFSTTVNSKQARYFSTQNLIKITSPLIELVTIKGDNVSISAQNGEYFSNTEILTLRGDVIITQVFPNNKTRVMKSQEFSYNSSTHFLSTKYAVEIEQNSSIINAIGLNAWINEHKIDLLSKVRGHFEVTNI